MTMQRICISTQRKRILLPQPHTIEAIMKLRKN
jgi:hypothetical protein